jgi:hypothetical protein
MPGWKGTIHPGLPTDDLEENQIMFATYTLAFSWLWATDGPETCRGVVTQSSENAHKYCIALVYNINIIRDAWSTKHEKKSSMFYSLFKKLPKCSTTLSGQESKGQLHLIHSINIFTEELNMF